MLDQEELQEILIGESDDEDEFVDVNVELSNMEPEISMNVVVGEFHPKTSRVTEFHKKEPVKILIYSGSTHNFVKASVVR